MSRIDTRSQCRMRRISICRSKILIFGFHQNRVLQALFCSKTLLLMVKCDVLGQFQAFKIVTAVILLYAKLNFLGPISQNGIFYGSQVDLSITFESVGRFA